MAKKLPAGLRISPKRIPGIGNRIQPKTENIALDRPPDAIARVATDTHGRGLRNTNFRLPYLSNLRKMDPIFDDPYEVAAQTIRKTQKPGDPEVVLDPDGLYENEDGTGFDRSAQHAKYGDNIPKSLRTIFPPKKSFEEDELERAGTDSVLSHLLVHEYVQNQTGSGKIRSVFCLVVVGNGKGMVGYGQGKAVVFKDALRVALTRAKKNMIPVNRYEGRTVYGEIEGKFKASTVFLRSRPPGFGIRANRYVLEICRCAGISDVGAKVRGSMNGMNIVKAVFEAFRQQKLPSTIAKERGAHLIDVRERYFHGQ
jgi:ribosomal protein S5